MCAGARPRGPGASRVASVRSRARPRTRAPADSGPSRENDQRRRRRWPGPAETWPQSSELSTSRWYPRAGPPGIPPSKPPLTESHSRTTPPVSRDSARLCIASRGSGGAGSASRMASGGKGWSGVVLVWGWGGEEVDMGWGARGEGRGVRGGLGRAIEPSGHTGGRVEEGHVVRVHLPPPPPTSPGDPSPHHPPLPHTPPPHQPAKWNLRIPRC